MSPPTSSSSKRPAPRSTSGSSSAKKGPASKSTLAGKRSASAALADDRLTAAGNKRAKRSASGKKSLREEELGVGGELADEDMIDTQEEQGQGGDDDDDDEDDDGEEGDGGVTRCVCGEDSEEMASGLMIQCDTCTCWQHGPCVGLWDEKECPNRYFCELCKPNLHGPGGLLRKVSRKSSAPARGRSPSAGLSSSSKHASSSTAPAPVHSTTSNKPRASADAALVHAFLAGEHVPDSKKRSTMNSRDAAYDDAIALSILEAGGAAMRARLERARGDGSDEDDDGSEDDVVEEIIVGPGRGRKKSAPLAGAGKGAAKKGAGGGAKKGTKGRSAPSRGRRSHSNPEADSPAPHDDADVEPKLEGAEGADEPRATVEDGEGEAAPRAEEGEEAEGEMGPPGKRRRVSPPPGDDEKKAEDAEESRATEQSEGAAALEEAVVEPEARSPSPQPSPVQHHGGVRAKHPNQYTYRPKNGQPAPARAQKSPVKRAHAVAAAAPESNGRGSASSGAAASGSATTFGWGMPEHLKHLAYLLPTQSPRPLVITSAVDPSAPPVAEPATKVRFPGKRVTMPEMRKRARTVLDFVTKVQLEMSERERRWDLLRDVNERIREARERDRDRERGRRGVGSAASGSGSGSGAGSGEGGSRASSVVAHPRGVGGTTPDPSGPAASDLALDALPPLPGSSAGAGGVELSSAPSAESTALMDALARDVIQFQQRFFGIVE